MPVNAISATSTRNAAIERAVGGKGAMKIKIHVPKPANRFGFNVGGRVRVRRGMGNGNVTPQQLAQIQAVRQRVQNVLNTVQNPTPQQMAEIQAVRQRVAQVQANLNAGAQTSAGMSSYYRPGFSSYYRPGFSSFYVRQGYPLPAPTGNRLYAGCRQRGMSGYWEDQNYPLPTVQRRGLFGLRRLGNGDNAGPNPATTATSDSGLFGDESAVMPFLTSVTANSTSPLSTPASATAAIAANVGGTALPDIDCTDPANAANPFCAVPASSASSWLSGSTTIGSYQVSNSTLAIGVALIGGVALLSGGGKRRR
jgi:hypothetical protein